MPSMSEIARKNGHRVIDATDTYQIPLDALHDHPQNEEVYGPILVDEVFLDSIRRNGLMQPICVVEWPELDTPEMSYRIISGHRRVHAMRQLGMRFASCKLLEFEGEEQETQAFIESNRQREKTDAMRLREALALVRMQDSCQNEGKNRKTVYDNNLEAVKKDDTGTVSREVATKQADAAVDAGVSLVTYQRVVAVFSERYRDHVVEEVTHGHKSPKAAAKKLVAAWDKIREQVLSGTCSVKDAATEIRALRASNGLGAAKTAARKAKQAETGVKMGRPKKERAATPILDAMMSTEERLEELVAVLETEYFSETGWSLVEYLESKTEPVTTRTIIYVLHRAIGDRIFSLLPQ